MNSFYVSVNMLGQTRGVSFINVESKSQLQCHSVHVYAISAIATLYHILNYGSVNILFLMFYQKQHKLNYNHHLLVLAVMSTLQTGILYKI